MQQLWPEADPAAAADWADRRSARPSTDPRRAERKPRADRTRGCTLVRVTTSGADQPRQQRPDPGELLDELLRRKNVQPIRTVDELACDGIFDTDDEVDEFIAFTYAQRRART